MTIPHKNIPQAPITKELIGQYLPAHPVIIEAGAHIGRDTVKMARLWPTSTIYAFEPVPALYAQLLENTKQYNNVHCIPYALSTHTGTAHLHVSTGASTAVSSLHEPLSYIKDRPDVLFHQEEVKTITLDAWATDQGINRVDFLWLDMQGHELDVLKSASLLLPTVSTILIEVNLTERFKDNPSYDMVLSYMHAHGFQAIQEDVPKHNKINILFHRAHI